MCFLLQIFPCQSLTYVNFSQCEFIRKLPDLSMTPNVKKLDLSSCKNLVEVHDSIGGLDKLEVLNLADCKKLRILPSCIMMKSLTTFILSDCSSLKKFPNISQEMKSIQDLALDGTSICELPPSFGNLIGLKSLRLGNHLGVVHIPGSIYKLQHIETLIVEGDVIFSKDVEIDRQPLCNSCEGFSKFFQSLKFLSLQYFKIRSEIDFILTSCCSLTLERLFIYDSNVVTLPESISRCKRLLSLFIENCNELQEIPRLPQSVTNVEASDCDSLDSSSLRKLFLQVSLSLSLCESYLHK